MKDIDFTKTCYIFDVDGTLTEPRKEIDNNFKKLFLKWAKNKQVFISTGSDYPKAKKQLSKDVIEEIKLIFCCMANEIRDPSGKILEKSDFIIPQDLEDDLANFLKVTKFSYKTGNHLEFRTGMLNFSIVGRNANPKEREEYCKWDIINQERKSISDFINKEYPSLEASIGGSISIDIIEKSKDKGQTITYLKNKGMKKVVFIGDKCYEGGNDYGIIRELLKSNLVFEWYNVSGFLDTEKLIKENISFK